MYYINSKPTENGNYGNPQSDGWDGAYELPDALLSNYIESMGFVILTVTDGVVTAIKRNEEAYAAYQAEHPAPSITPAQKRENVYDTDAIIEWDGGMITVTHAAELWNYYAAEGSEKASELQTLIAAAKKEIRETYPDT